MDQLHASRDPIAHVHRYAKQNETIGEGRHEESLTSQLTVYSVTELKRARQFYESTIGFKEARVRDDTLAESRMSS